MTSQHQSKSAKAQQRLAKLLAAGLALVVVIVVIGFWFTAETRVPVHPSTFCPTTSGVPSTTLILVDRDAQLSKEPSKFLERKMGDESIEFRRYERVIVLALGKNGIMDIPMFDKCSPGKAEEANPLIENPKAIGRKYTEKFINPMVASVRDMAIRVATDAPLIEALSSLSKRSETYFVADAGRSEEHTSEPSHG